MAVVTDPSSGHGGASKDVSWRGLAGGVHRAGALGAHVGGTHVRLRARPRLAAPAPPARRRDRACGKNCSKVLCIVALHIYRALTFGEFVSGRLRNGGRRLAQE